jgi:hypothetical protein
MRPYATNRNDAPTITKVQNANLGPNASEEQNITNHGGGDDGLVRAFIFEIVSQKHQMQIDPVNKASIYSYLQATPEETLQSHLFVFHAEESRKKREIIDMQV